MVFNLVWLGQVKVQHVDSQLSGDPCLILPSPLSPITIAVRISESDVSWVLQVSMQWMHIRWEDAGIYEIFVEGTHLILLTGSLITIKKSFHLVDLIRGSPDMKE